MRYQDDLDQGSSRDEHSIQLTDLHLLRPRSKYVRVPSDYPQDPASSYASSSPYSKAHESDSLTRLNTRNLPKSVEQSAFTIHD